MCRYAFSGPYKQHMACFNCRIALKTVTICPNCNNAMVNMGLDFKAPKRRDTKQWKKVELLYQNGVHFSSCGCGGPGYRPKRLNELADFLAAQEKDRWNKSEGEKLLDKFNSFGSVK
jgi:hypothetical protein